MKRTQLCQASLVGIWECDCIGCHKAIVRRGLLWFVACSVLIAALSFIQVGEAQCINCPAGRTCSPPASCGHGCPCVPIQGGLGVCAGG